jgi:hypothetical protein
MKLNGVETNISSFTSETLNDEMVLYNEESKKIVVLNQTAMLVWKEITENHLKNKNLCTKDIAYVILNTYELSKSEIDAVCNDIDETIELLFQSSLLKK